MMRRSLAPVATEPATAGGRLVLPLCLLLVPALVEGDPAIAQSPTVPPRLTTRPSDSSSLGQPPGSNAAPDIRQAEPSGILGGRPGPSVTRAPAGITRPGPGGFAAPGPAAATPPELAPPSELPVYGTLALPSGDEDEGPPDGLTLEAAIARMIRENLTLRAQFQEIPLAEADILTAGLRANPVLYADAQLIPYGNFSRQRPGGGTQYDLNISHPFDLSGKRRARTIVACRAKRVVEAQYQNAVRLQIANLGTAFVDVLAARETLRFSQASLANLEQVLSRLEEQLKQGEIEESKLQVDRIRMQRDAARLAVRDAQEALRRARRDLGPLLRLPPQEAERIEVRGMIRDRAPRPPSGVELARLALASRPDLIAYRLGVHRAEADVALARAERFEDIYVLYQPYTFQNNAPFDAKSAHSWAVGVTVPLPIYNRNQGNIQRARHNVEQTRIEMAALEQDIISEVRQAEREYLTTRQIVEDAESSLLPAARRLRDEAFDLWSQGELELVEFLNARRDYNDVVRQYRDAAIRHRRSMLDLDTAVGLRILP